MSENQLPSNCLDCPNHKRGQYVNIRSDDGINCYDFPVICSLTAENLGIARILGDIHSAPQSAIAVSSQCPIRKEEQPWLDETMVPGVIFIEIEGLGSFGSDQPSLCLIQRALHVLVIKTGKYYTGVPPFKLISTDMVARKAVYRRKET